MKKLIILTVFVFALALLVAPAAQAKIVIRETGPLSTNKVDITSTKNANVSGNMVGGITNRTILFGNSGLNFAIGNTKAGNITTDDVKLTVDNQGQVNDRIVAINQGTAEPCCDILIDQTGPLSTNKVTITNTKNVTVSGNMTGNVQNDTIAIGNSGGNFQIGNTKAGNIDTGKVTIENKSVSVVNTSVVSITQ